MLISKSRECGIFIVKLYDWSVRRRVMNYHVNNSLNILGSMHGTVRRRETGTYIIIYTPQHSQPRSLALY